MEEETVKLSYSSFSNITFRGTIDTGIPWSEWNEMTIPEQSDIMSEMLFNLVDVSVVDDDS